MPAMIELTCGFCEKNFFRKLKYVTSEKKRGRTVFYCGLSCAKRKLWTRTTCHNCGKGIAIRPSAKRSKSGFYYCSRSCSATKNNTIYKSKENHPNWINGKGSYRSVGLEDRCEDCGESRYYLLIVHHRNKDKSVNGKQNLATLCYNCHAMRHLVVRDGKLWVNWKVLTSEEARVLM